jgi:hypothetical protein
MTLCVQVELNIVQSVVVFSDEVPCDEDSELGEETSAGTCGNLTKKERVSEVNVR